MTKPKIVYPSIKVNAVQGRYLTNEDSMAFLEKVSGTFLVETVGHSVQERPIKTITLGTGKRKIMMWSQMHGNESTTTKAVLDFINFLNTPSELAHTIKESCTITIIPVLNPDGAAAYTRVNANGIDLNRDAQNRSQPESKVLRQIFDDFQPDHCFNLHDQRTIFNVGETPKPATVSFLAPAHDGERSISKTRAVSMQLIVGIHKVLQQLIPGQIGRYDDAFNSNCIGDTFQMLNVPTVLFEAGHFPNDYQREKTREYIFIAMVAAVELIAKNTIGQYRKEDYFAIPENNKRFFDILIKNAHIVNASHSEGSSIGILFKEVLMNGSIVFEPTVEKTGNLDNCYGHKTLNCLDNNDLKVLKASSEITRSIT